MHDLHRALAVWRQDPVVSVYWPRDGKHLHVFCILYPNTHATRIFFEPYWLFSLPPSLSLSCFHTFMFSSLCLPVQFMPVTDIVFGWVVMAICSPETFKPWLWELWNLFCCQYFFFFFFISLVWSACILVFKSISISSGRRNGVEGRCSCLKHTRSWLVAFSPSVDTNSKKFQLQDEAIRSVAWESKIWCPTPHVLAFSQSKTNTLAATNRFPPVGSSLVSDYHRDSLLSCFSACWCGGILGEGGTPPKGQGDGRNNPIVSRPTASQRMCKEAEAAYVMTLPKP